LCRRRLTYISGEAVAPDFRGLKFRGAFCNNKNNFLNRRESRVLFLKPAFSAAETFAKMFLSGSRKAAQGF
jgi:hypothetical protein